MKPLSLSLRLLPLLLLASCQGMQVAFLKFGSTDRKQALVAEVRDIQEIQVEAQEDFLATLGLFRQVVETKQPEQLEALYDDLQDGVDDCADDVEALRKHIAAVESDATKLFEEWRAELDLFTRQLANILHYAEQVQRIDTTGIPPTASIVSGQASDRADVVCPSLAREEALANAPDGHLEAGLFRVPRVIG